MRSPTAVVVLVLVTACAHPSRQHISGPACPRADSLYTTTPPLGPGRDAYTKGPYARFITYVVDSLYVVRNQPREDASAPNGLLSQLTPSDIYSIEVLKGAAGERWSACPGVPVIIIVTKSRTWHPASP